MNLAEGGHLIHITSRPLVGFEADAVAELAHSSQEGYVMEDAAGEKTWVPKDVFHRYCLPMDVNKNLKTDRPSISQKMVEDYIAYAEAQTMGDKTTVVRAVLKNGFEIVEASSCVSPENYDEALGREICMERVRNKVWMLLGFLLQTAAGDGDHGDGR